MEEIIHKEDAQEQFTDCLGKLSNSRTYNKILKELGRLRSNVMGRMKLDEYKTLLREQIDKIEGIFSDKSFPVKKITTIITKSLSPLESRLLKYGNFTTKHIEVDEIQKLSAVLDYSVDFPKEYIPYEEKKNKSGYVQLWFCFVSD